MIGRHITSKGRAFSGAPGGRWLLVEVEQSATVRVIVSCESGFYTRTFDTSVALPVANATAVEVFVDELTSGSVSVAFVDECRGFGSRWRHRASLVAGVTVDVPPGATHLIPASNATLTWTTHVASTAQAVTAFTLYPALGHTINPDVDLHLFWFGGDV